jgi:hypothetical protein
LSNKLKQGDMENNNKHFKIPEDYFSNMEDRVMSSFYKSKRKERRLRILKVTSLVAVVLVVGSLVKFLPYDSMNNDIKKDNLYTKLMDTQQQKTEIANKDYSLTEKKQSNFSPKQRLDEKKQSNFSSNETQRKPTHYTEEELQYLEQYIKEDGYELIANR